MSARDAVKAAVVALAVVCGGSALAAEVKPPAAKSAAKTVAVAGAAGAAQAAAKKGAVKHGRAKAEGRKRAARVAVSGVVNLNEATAAQLDQLPGVSPKVAAAVVAQREKQPFARIEEVVTVKGFGKKRFEKVKPFLGVSGATTLKVDKPLKASAKTSTPTAQHALAVEAAESLATAEVPAL